METKHTPDTIRLAQDLAVRLGHKDFPKLSVDLYAAAPELLAELQKAAYRIEAACRILEAQHVRLSPGYQYDLEMLREQGKQARAAIAKATGGA